MNNYIKATFLKGTIWTRDIDDFVGYTEIEGQQVKTFTLAQNSH